MCMGVFVMIYHVHTYITEKIWVIRVHLTTHKSFISFAFQRIPTWPRTSAWPQGRLAQNYAKLRDFLSWDLAKLKFFWYPLAEYPPACWLVVLPGSPNSKPPFNHLVQEFCSHFSIRPGVQALGLQPIECWANTCWTRQPYKTDTAERHCSAPGSAFHKWWYWWYENILLRDSHP